MAKPRAAQVVSGAASRNGLESYGITVVYLRAKGHRAAGLRLRRRAAVDEPAGGQ